MANVLQLNDKEIIMLVRLNQKELNEGKRHLQGLQHLSETEAD